MRDQFYATIDRLYAAAADRTLWDDALASIERLSDCAGVVVHIVPDSDPSKTQTLLGDSARGYFLAEHVAEWTRNYAAICPRLAAAQKWPDAPYYADYMLMSERQMDLDPVYNWYGAHGLRYFIGSKLCRDREVEIVWSIQRRRDQGHVQQPEIDLFQRLKPHLARSLGLARQLGTMRNFEQFSQAALEAFPQALFALNGQGRVRFMNTAASSLIGSNDGLSVEHGRLFPSSSQDLAVLKGLIASALARRIDGDRGWMRISRPSGKLPLAAFVSPVSTVDDELFAAGIKLFVIIHDPSTARSPCPAMLRQLYELTEAEARLASAIGGGHSLESAAATLGMRVATARSHLKSIFAKLGVNRQQDLVRLLTSLASLDPAP